MRVALFALALIAPTGALLADAPMTIGGDQYIASAGSEDLAAPRDVFATGPAISLEGEAAGDIFATGYDVEIEARAKDVFAAGGSVEIEAEIAEDLTAAGGTVSIDDDAKIGGNARIAGGSVVVEGEIVGALLAAAGEIELNSRIGGDVYLAVGDIEFGDDAEIGGTLTYAAAEEIDVPAHVAPPERIVFQALDIELGDAVPNGPARWAHEREGSGFGAALFLLGALAFVALIAALLLHFARDEVEARREASMDRPGVTTLFGVFAFSLLFGLVPITALTLVGAPLIPIVLLAILLLWLLGYVLGAYFVGRSIWDLMREAEPALMTKIALVAGGTVCLLLLTLIPIVGWLLSLCVVFLGAGALVAALIERFMGRAESAG